MSQKLKVRKIDGSLGFVLPESVAQTLALQEGDEMDVSIHDHTLHISHIPDLGEMMDDARAFMQTHRDTFEKLSK